MKYLFYISMILLSVIYISSGCKDLLPQCRSLRNRCKEPVMAKFLSQNCKYTCKLCPGDENKGTCDDDGDNCNEMKSYCDKEPYKEMLKVRCKRTCGIC
uniref:ShKT domain-containing protein n=1 Tax=Parastrongyloides trichosuri TaxID=131310 RepID=A0A0N4Z4C3_PARTI